MSETKTKGIKKIFDKRYMIVIAGLTAGLIAALLQVFANLYPPNSPVAYGICIACHGRDLVDWLVDAFAGANLLSYGTLVVGVPVLTIVGIVIGGSGAAVRNKEFKFRTTKNPIVSFVCGFIVMISALTLGACPLRTVLRIAYGDVIAIIGFIAIAVGVTISALLIRMNAKRAISKGGM